MEADNYWQRLARRRMSRRRLLQASAAAALGGAALVVVGCEGGEEGPGLTATPAEGEPKYGGVLRFGYGTDPVGLDPHMDVAALSIMAKMYSYLYHVGEGSRAVMNLAESMEHPEADTFVFKLKQNARFQPKPPVDGREITAEDVRYSFQRRSSALVSIDLRFPSIIDRMEAVDDHTFRLITKRPFAPAFYEMGNNTWAIVPQEAVKRFGDLKQNPISGGPFMLKPGGFVRAERVEMEKNPNFYFPGRPYLDGIEYIVIPDDSALLAAFQSKQHDINGATLNALRVRDLRQNKDIRIIQRPDLYYPVLMVKTSKPPFDDIRVREAVDLAIDRQEIIDKIFFGEAKINGPIAWGHEFWALPQEELQQFYQPNPERAKQLLADAGYPDGLSVTLKTANNPGNWRDIVTLVADQLGRVGIKVDLQLMELGTWLGSVLIIGNFDMTFLIHLPYEEPDRPLSLYHSLGISGGGNMTGYGNPELDALIDAQQRSFDDNERQRLILQAQRLILREHGPQFTLCSGYNYTAYWNYVKGWWPEGPETHANDYNWEYWLDKA